MSIASNEIVFKTFLISYRHEGADWIVELKAASEKDARLRLTKLVYGNVDGELIAAIPANRGWIARMRVALRNAFGLRSW